MKTITQSKIAKILNRSQSFVSKRLSKNALRGFEILKLSKELNIPAETFLDADLQIKYLGKSYLQENNTQTKKSEQAHGRAIK